MSSELQIVRGSSITVWGFACCAIVAAAVALPTNKEIAHGLIVDGNFKDARVRLIGLHAQGAGDIHSAIALHQLHLGFGDLNQADQVIQEVLQKQPANVELLKRAARFYKQVQNPAKRLEILVRLLNISPTSETLDEALLILRLEDNYEGEKAVLGRFANSPVLKVAHHERLGNLFARDQKLELAVRHFVRSDAMSGVPNWRLRFALFRILLLQQRFSQSRSFMEQWLSEEIDHNQLSLFYKEAIDAKRLQLAQLIIKEALRRNHISQADAVSLRRGARE
ncbi:MAG: hypothetical protein JXQ99_07585 [Hyphomicrobiaceae bacterium]